MPLDLVEPLQKRSGHKISTLIENFRLSAPRPAKSDLATLALLQDEVGLVTVDKINVTWADIWVSKLKLDLQPAPGSIRKRVECLARVIDWHIRKITPADQSASVNPLRVMPRGYSIYTAKEAAVLVHTGKEPKTDTKRDRRLAPGEEQKIRNALAGIKAPDRQRHFVVDEYLTLLFDLILNTGLRLREAYWLRCEEFNQGRGLLLMRGTKGHSGVIKPRLVPVVPGLREKLRVRCAGKTGLIFPCWDGNPYNLSKVTSALSSRFKTLFNYAGMPDLTEHDLRHEATCG